MRSKTLDRILKEMENDPWHVKLRRWWRVRLWGLRINRRLC